MSYVAQSLWRAVDGSIMLRTIEVIEDVDGNPAGLIVTEEPYDRSTLPPWPGEDS